MTLTIILLNVATVGGNMNNGIVEILGFKLFNIDILLVFLLFIGFTALIYKIKIIRVGLDKIANLFVEDENE